MIDFCLSTTTDTDCVISIYDAFEEDAVVLLLEWTGVCFFLVSIKVEQTIRTA